MAPHHYPGIDVLKTGVHKAKKFISLSKEILGIEITTHNNSVANLVCGVGQRVLYVDSKLNLTPSCEAGIFESQLASYRRTIAKTIGFQSSVGYEEFLTYYKGRRLAVYGRAVDGLALSPLQTRDANLKTFVKSEKLNLQRKANPVPRVIQPRSPRYNVELGRFLRPIEKKIYHAIDDLFGSPTIMSEYNSYEQAKHIKAKWDTFVNPVCVGMDASRFDQHVSTEALKFEHSLYDMIFHSRALRRILALQLVNTGFAEASDGKFRYVKRGSRMSGDMNTSLGNKIIMCLMSKRYLSTLAYRVEFLNNGDDCLLILEKKHLFVLKSLREYYLRYGFNIITETPVSEFEQIEFCQTKPLLGTGVYRMVRNFQTAIPKDLTCLNLGYCENEYRAWLGAVADCGLTTCLDIPVMGEFYSMLKRLSVPGKVSNDDDISYRVKISKSQHTPGNIVTSESRYSFWLSSGISPDLQVVLENYFSSIVWGCDNRQIIEIISYLFK